MERLVVLCVLLGLSTALPLDELSFLQTDMMAGVNVSAININAGGQRESRLTLGDADQAFTLSMQPDGSFAIRHGGQPNFVIDAAGPVSVAGTLKSVGAMRIAGTVNFQGVQQWFLSAIENFNEGAIGWSNSSTTSCGNTEKMILGGCGKFAGGEVSKVFRNLPVHDVVRLRANFHFIDKWGGETAYARLQDNYVWTDSFDQVSSKTGVDLCCSPAPESKYSVPVDVTLPHSDTSLKVTFGSTLSGSPLDQSWGVSDVQIYVRKI
jgi:hypothetical protein